MRINQEFRDVLTFQLLQFGFQPSTDGKRLSQNGVVAQFLPANRRPTDREPDETRFYTLTLRNMFARRQIVDFDAAAKAEIDVRNLAIDESNKNEELFARRERLCNDIKTYCEERRLQVNWIVAKLQPRVVKFTLYGWEHVVFSIYYEASHNKFYVRMAGDYNLFEIDRGDQLRDESEFYAWVENGNDVAAWAEKSFDPKEPAQGNNQISTLGEPGQWLHWMFTYGFDKLETLEVMTHRKSDSQLVNALLPNDDFEVTLSTLTFIDRVPYFHPREKEEPAPSCEKKCKRPKLDISNE